MRLPTLPMILKSSLAIFKYLVLFLIIYLLINWLRQPIMPVKPNLQLKDYQGTPIDIAAISHNLANIYKDINIILRLLMIPMDKYSPTGKDKWRHRLLFYIKEKWLKAWQVFHHYGC